MRSPPLQKAQGWSSVSSDDTRILAGKRGASPPEEVTVNYYIKINN